jgi:Uncharacterized protein with a C-terminal OMP (outer membrane protein) domain
MALTLDNLILHGAHSRPLARQAAPGKKIFWAAGDWGTDKHGERDGDLGVAEIGTGQHFGSVQANLSLGQSWAEQQLAHNGEAKAKGTYLMAETLIQLGGNLWASAGGYYQWGDIDVRRGYLNAGLPDASSGSADNNTWAIRGRLIWENAFALSGTSFAPYLDLSHTESRIDSYTETGGGFPAQYNARTERATELRLGTHAVRPVSSRLNLIGTLELAHRFQQDTIGVSGQVPGLFAFNYAGTDTRQTWLRAGGGVEGALGNGKAALMLNLTTEGEVPNAWFAASYQVEF